MDTRKEKMKGNSNAEKWTEEVATDFMNKAVAMSKDKEYDFIGEVAYDLDQDKGVFDYLVDKFPHLKKLKTRIKSNCEVNCFRNIKKENINTGAGIMNLKSNHGWTDRVQQDHVTKGKEIQPTFIVQTQEQAKDQEDFLKELEEE